MLVPTQPVANGGVGDLEWEIVQAAGNGESVVARVSRRMRTSEHLIVRWSPALLKNGARPLVLEGPRPRVGEGGVGRALRVLLPPPASRSGRLRRGRAGRHSGAGTTSATRPACLPEGRFEGLTLASSAAAIYVDAASVLVKPDVARRQLEAERPFEDGPARSRTLDPGPGPWARSVAGSRTCPDPAAAAPSAPVLRHRSRSIPDRAGRDMGQARRGGPPAPDDRFRTVEGQGDRRNRGRGDRRSLERRSARHRRELPHPAFSIARVRGVVRVPHRRRIRPAIMMCPAGIEACCLF